MAAWRRRLRWYAVRLYKLDCRVFGHVPGVTTMSWYERRPADTTWTRHTKAGPPCCRACYTMLEQAVITWPAVPGEVVYVDAVAVMPS